jgi:hypothetical protein
MGEALSGVFNHLVGLISGLSALVGHIGVVVILGGAV